MNFWKKNQSGRGGMIRSLAVMMLAVVMILPGVVMGEGASGAPDAVVPQLQPMMDLVTAAAKASGTEVLAEGQPLTAEFVHAFFALGQSADASLGITAEMKSDASAQAAYLQRAFSASAPQGADSLFLEPTETEFIGVQYMTGTVSEDGMAAEVAANVYQAPKPMAQMTEEDAAHIKWLGQTAAFSFRKAEDAPNGWRLAAFSFAGDHLEADVDAYFSENMTEYINDRLGFSLLYPAEFTADILMETEQGIQGSLPDNSASFFARRMDNDNHRSQEDVVASWRQEHPEMEISVNDITGLIKGTYQDGDGKNHVRMMLVTPGYLYEAGLDFNQDKMKAYSLYTEYMSNSFVATELGIG